MPGSKANVQATNPPPNTEPYVVGSMMFKLSKPQEEAKQKPRSNHHKRRLQENSLRLSEFLDWIKWENGFWKRKAEAVVHLHTRVRVYGRPSPEIRAAVCCDVQKLPRRTRAPARVVDYWLARTFNTRRRHSSLPGSGSESESESKIKITTRRLDYKTIYY